MAKKMSPVQRVTTLFMLLPLDDAEKMLHICQSIVSVRKQPPVTPVTLVKRDKIRKPEVTPELKS